MVAIWHGMANPVHKCTSSLIPRLMVGPSSCRVEAKPDPLTNPTFQ